MSKCRRGHFTVSSSFAIACPAKLTSQFWHFCWTYRSSKWKSNWFFSWPSTRPPTWPSWFFARCKLCRLRSGWSCDTWVQEGKRDGKAKDRLQLNHHFESLASLVATCDSSIITYCSADDNSYQKMPGLCSNIRHIGKRCMMCLASDLKSFSRSTSNRKFTKLSVKRLSERLMTQSSWRLILSSCCAFNTWRKHLHPWNRGIQFLMQIYMRLPFKATCLNEDMSLLYIWCLIFSKDLPEESAGIVIIQTPTWRKSNNSQFHKALKTWFLAITLEERSLLIWLPLYGSHVDTWRMVWHLLLDVELHFSFGSREPWKCMYSTEFFPDPEASPLHRIQEDQKSTELKKSAIKTLNLQNHVSDIVIYHIIKYL